MQTHNHMFSLIVLHPTMHPHTQAHADLQIHWLEIHISLSVPSSDIWHICTQSNLPYASVQIFPTHRVNLLQTLSQIVLASGKLTIFNTICFLGQNDPGSSISRCFCNLNPAPLLRPPNPVLVTYCGRPERRTAAGRERSSWQLADAFKSPGKSGWAERRLWWRGHKGVEVEQEGVWSWEGVWGH